MLLQVTDDFGRENFGRRQSSARQPCSILVVRNLGMAREAEVSTLSHRLRTGDTFLHVRICHHQIEAAFRAFAPVKGVKVNCNQTGESRGFAFVEFHSVEVGSFGHPSIPRSHYPDPPFPPQEASHVLDGTKSLRIGGRPVSVAFASQSMLHERPSWAQSTVAKGSAAQTSSQVQAYGTMRLHWLTVLQNCNTENVVFLTVKKLKLKKNSSPWPLPFEEAGGRLAAI